MSLATRAAALWPCWGPVEIESAIRAGEILVEGSVVTNPRAQVMPDAAVRHAPPAELAGRRKLGWAIDHFGVAAADRAALDVGACTGGFTTAWLDAGATTVYAVDAGHGQLLGSLRQDPRVVNLERTNLADLGPGLVPDEIHLLSIDVSYLGLAAAVAQLEGIRLADEAVLLGLVKPMFELRLATIPAERLTLERARDAAIAGVAAAGWVVLAAEQSPVVGGRGAIEFFIHARRE